jgi:hypothetical protein
MKTKLPESRNRNLPGPHADADDEPQRKPLPRPPLPERERREGPSFARSLLAMLIVTGLFGTGIFFYMRNAEKDAGMNDIIESELESAGNSIWTVGRSSKLFAETEEAKKDLEDLPRVVMAVRASLRGSIPDITVAEGDPPHFVGSHQILYRANKEVVFVVRVRYQKSTGLFEFLGEKNTIKASRKDQKKETPPTPAEPNAAPQPAPPGEAPAVPASPASSPPATPPAARPPSAEKVSEQP